jgi:serine/threonine protein kinase
MGRVYLSYTPGGRPAAIKVIRAEYAEDPGFRRRFEQEVATAQRVQGLYTAPVIDANTRAEQPWLVTAYVAGPSLQQAVGVYGPLPVEASWCWSRASPSRATSRLLRGTGRSGKWLLVAAVGHLPAMPCPAPVVIMLCTAISLLIAHSLPPKPR